MSVTPRLFYPSPWEQIYASDFGDFGDGITAYNAALELQNCPLTRGGGGILWLWVWSSKLKTSTCAAIFRLISSWCWPNKMIKIVSFRLSISMSLLYILFYILYRFPNMKDLISIIKIQFTCPWRMLTWYTGFEMRATYKYIHVKNL